MKCPIHGIPDCSPLLNGCSLVNQIWRMVMDEAETIWEHAKTLIHEAEQAPESDYRTGFVDSLSSMISFIEDEYEVLGAVD